MTAEVENTSLAHTPAPITRKLDLAGGQNCREGFECVDIFEGARHQVNLLKFPWPFADSSVAELNCSHFVEHIPQVEVDEQGNQVPWGSGGQNMFFRFFDECYRILIPGGGMKIHVPAHRNDRAFWDPTHQRFITPVTFMYLNAEWRKAQKLDHYNVKCNFAGNTSSVYDAELSARHPEAQQRLMNHYWNTIIDWVCDLVSMKPGVVESR